MGVEVNCCPAAWTACVAPLKRSAGWHTTHPAVTATVLVAAIPTLAAQSGQCPGSATTPKITLEQYFPVSCRQQERVGGVPALVDRFEIFLS